MFRRGWGGLELGGGMEQKFHFSNLWKCNPPEDKARGNFGSSNTRNILCLSAQTQIRYNFVNSRISCKPALLFLDTSQLSGNAFPTALWAHRCLSASAAPPPWDQALEVSPPLRSLGRGHLHQNRRGIRKGFLLSVDLVICLPMEGAPALEKEAKVCEKHPGAYVPWPF